MDELTCIKSDSDVLKTDILLVSCVQNEYLRIPWFINYHRCLGVDKFIFIDNESQDESLEFLRQQKDTIIYSASGSYAASQCGVDWLNQALAIHADGHWVLILDADEQLVYPECETRGLSELISYLQRSGANAMKAPLIDMYPGGPIRRANYGVEESFLSASPYFDADGYQWSEQEDRVPNLERGGVRHRLFWSGRDRRFLSPYLHKIPLVKWNSESRLHASTHVWKNARYCQISGALLHFKMFQDFPERALEEANRKEHFAGARQYSAYADVFMEDPDLCAYFDGSCRYENSDLLSKMGFMSVPDDY